MRNLDGKLLYFTSCSSHNSSFEEVGKRPISRWLRFGRKRIYQEKNKAIRIASKHDDSLETFPYAIHRGG